jgi:hypothetical protein
VNFLGLTKVAMVDFMVGVDVAADCSKVVCLVDAVVADWNLVDEGKAIVVADLDFIGEVSAEDFPPSLKRSLSATRQKLQTIKKPCY